MASPLADMVLILKESAITSGVIDFKGLITFYRLKPSSSPARGTVVLNVFAIVTTLTYEGSPPVRLGITVYLTVQVGSFMLSLRIAWQF
jgi:hypothetical protein